MAIVNTSMWAHGLGIFLEDNSWTVARRGGGATVFPSTTSTAGWVHFAIPTPAKVNGVKPVLFQVVFRFNSGPQAHVTAVHVYSNEGQIAAADGLNLTGSVESIIGVPDQVAADAANGISLHVNFGSPVPSTDAWITLIGAGAHYQ